MQGLLYQPPLLWPGFMATQGTNTLTVVLTLVKYWTTATQLFKMPTRPSPAVPSTNLITILFCYSLPIDRNSNRKYLC
jgi:hypothetical protein